MTMRKISCSLVLYNHTADIIHPLIHQLYAEELISEIWILDNSPKPIEHFPFKHPKINYIHNQQNLGYGKAHNIALQSNEIASEYHIVMNPDILLQPNAIESLYDYMESMPNSALVMPQVLYPDNSMQYLCKLLPTPLDLIFRRFIPQNSSLYKRMQLRYELRDKDFNQTMQVPNLSGCFMFLRKSALKYTGVFDERFFMYLEDTDLCRRIHMQFDTIYFPKAQVLHDYKKGSYKQLRLLMYHIVSAVKYFQKWGWVFDSVRKDINRKFR